jgi:transcriptional regulator with XRE-family HTH domain
VFVATPSGCIITAMTTQQLSISFNERVGANVQRYRKTAGLSQAQLAEQLNKRGHAFAQQGILKIERGSRPLRLDEAQDIAEVLGVEPAALTRQMDERLAKLDQIRAAEAAIIRLDRERQEHWDKLSAQIAEVETQRQEAAQQLATILTDQGRPDLAQQYANLQPAEQMLADWRALHG